MPTVQLYLTLFFPPEILFILSLLFFVSEILSILSFLFFALEILFYVVIFCIRNPFFQNLYLYLKNSLFKFILYNICWFMLLKYVSKLMLLCVVFLTTYKVFKMLLEH